MFFLLGPQYTSSFLLILVDWQLTYTLFICMTSQCPNSNVILTCMNHCGGALNNSICYLYLIKIYIEIIQSLDTLLEQSVMDLDKRPAAVCDSSVKVSMWRPRLFVIEVALKIIYNWSCTWITYSFSIFRHIYHYLWILNAWINPTSTKEYVLGKGRVPSVGKVLCSFRCFYWHLSSDIHQSLCN